MKKLFTLTLVMALALTGLVGCTKKKENADGGQAKPPAAAPKGGDQGQSGGNSGSNQGTQQAVPALALNYLQQGTKSPDGLWVAALVPPGSSAETVGIWIAPVGDLNKAVRISQEVSASAGAPIWTPTAGLIFAGAGNVWNMAAPPEWKPQPFLPELFAGRQISIRPDAFSPDGTQFIYTVKMGGKDEVWLASITGQDIRHLGTNITAAWVNGELVTAEPGK